jgi:hypothetical protein
MMQSDDVREVVVLLLDVDGWNTAAGLRRKIANDAENFPTKNFTMRPEATYAGVQEKDRLWIRIVPDFSGSDDAESWLKDGFFNWRTSLQPRVNLKKGSLSNPFTCGFARIIGITVDFTRSAEKSVNYSVDLPGPRGGGLSKYCFIRHYPDFLVLEERAQLRLERPESWYKELPGGALTSA